jgi:hypothetical protein
MEWREHTPESCDEEFATEGLLQIEANGVCLTENVSDWVDSRTKNTMLSATPLAAWLCDSWWRLLYEPLPSLDMSELPLSWRMSHDMTAIGAGYIWPAIRFAADNNGIQIWTQAQTVSDKSSQPVFYLGAKPQYIPCEEVRFAFADIINATIDRLEHKRRPNSDLKSIWEQVQEEESAENLRLYRIIEAMLGYDIDEVPDYIMEIFLNIGNIFDASALCEIANACSIYEVEDQFKALNNIKAMAKGGLKGKIAAASVDLKCGKATLPWDYGRELARKVRAALGTTKSRMETSVLCDLFGITATQMRDTPARDENMSISRLDNDKIAINFKKDSWSYTSGRRFQLARLLGGVLISENKTGYIPQTSCKTWVQRVQRAFATEFLCPIEDLMGFIGSKLSQKQVDKAAKSFLVSPQTVIHNLYNNKKITTEDMLSLSF